VRVVRREGHAEHEGESAVSHGRPRTRGARAPGQIRSASPASRGADGRPFRKENLSRISRSGGVRFSYHLLMTRIIPGAALLSFSLLASSIALGLAACDVGSASEKSEDAGVPVTGCIPEGGGATPPAPSGSSGSSGSSSSAAKDPAGSGDKGSAKPTSLVEFTQFLKDYAAGSKTYRAKYPAGKTFTMGAKALAVKPFPEPE